MKNNYITTKHTKVSELKFAESSIPVNYQSKCTQQWYVTCNYQKCCAVYRIITEPQQLILVPATHRKWLITACNLKRLEIISQSCVIFPDSSSQTHQGCVSTGDLCFHHLLYSKEEEKGAIVERLQQPFYICHAFGAQTTED